MLFKAVFAYVLTNQFIHDSDCFQKRLYKVADTVRSVFRSVCTQHFLGLHPVLKGKMLKKRILFWIQFSSSRYCLKIVHHLIAFLMIVTGMWTCRMARSSICFLSIFLHVVCYDYEVK